MVTLEKRIELLERLGKYMLSDDEAWQNTQQRVQTSNPWFTQESVETAVRNIAESFLEPDKLKAWVASYTLPSVCCKVGIVMAGNIPLVGFHDFLCGFVCQHDLYLKLSSKDEVLLRHLIEKLKIWQPELEEAIHLAENLKNCDAYIATGSNNTARYFEQYFSRYPHLIRKNRTSVAILEGDEDEDELRALANDVFLYFGLGCRNVTQVCVPRHYDFSRLLETFRLYADNMLHHKYKNNYDYHFAVYLLNKVPFLTNDSLLLVENDLPFSAVSVLHYRYYDDMKALAHELELSQDIQTVIGRGFTPLGTAQQPSLYEYADGVDTMAFLCSLK